ncbi:MAG: FtsH protease activity modulator HflK [Oxalobacter sp.]|nr:FtsH protease activity modulator HflK [Oxalobacter sp.]
MEKTADIFNPEPIRDDLFGHGSSFNNEEPPPDVDKAWKNFNKKLNNLLGLKKKKGNGGDGEKPENDDPYNDARGFRIVLLLFALLVMVFWMVSGIYIVDEGQSAVISTFGRYTKTTSSGMKWHFPWPIQSHRFVETGHIQTVEVGYRESLSARKTEEALMMTSDRKMVEIQFSVQYRITNPTDWVFNNKNPEDIIRLCAETAFREIAVRRTFKELFYENRDQATGQVRQRLQEMLEKYRIGIEISGITVQDVRPPQPVQEVFADAEHAPQDVERMKNESENYVSSIVPKTNGEAEQLKTEAEAYKRQVIVRAEAEAERFRQILPEYKQAPAVTKDRLYLETMEQIYANTDKVLIDSQKKPVVRLPVYNSGGYPVRAEEQGECTQQTRTATLPDGSPQPAVQQENTASGRNGTDGNNAAPGHAGANGQDRSDGGTRSRENRSRGGRS